MEETGDSFMDMKSKKHKRLKTPDVEDMDPDTICGIGPFRPQWLQPWATAKTYLVLFSIIGIVQGAYFSTYVGNITTLEKRYAYESKISGYVQMFDELTPLLFGVPVGYFGTRAHKPRVVAIGMMMNVASCMVTSFPYFLHGPAKHLMSSTVQNQTSQNFCAVGGVTCEEHVRPQTFTAVACLFVGSFLKGFGALAYYSIGMIYLDDITKKKQLPIYFTLVTILRFFGPILGSFLTVTFLKYYEDPRVDPGFGPEDPRWIGAWWMCFVFQGALLFVVSLPLFLFPRRLPNQKRRASCYADTFASEQTISEKIKGIWKQITRLICNPLYVFFCLSAILIITREGGLFTMLPKYMEHQFRLTASKANLFSGPTAIVTFQISTLIGGLIMWKFQPSTKKLMGATVILESVAVITYFVMMAATCNKPFMAGTSVANGQLQLENICNQKCLCSTNVMSPLCGPDGVSSYFSPCHAGCVSSTFLNGTEVYQNCSCVIDEAGNFNFANELNSGFCPNATDCTWPMVAYILCIITACAGLCLVFVSHPIILLRAVDPVDRSMCYALFETSMAILGGMTFPVIYGSIADASCLVWESSCGETGNCWFYDMEKFNYLIHGTTAIFSVGAVLCYVVVYRYTHTVRDLYADEPN